MYWDVFEEPMYCDEMEDFVLNICVLGSNKVGKSMFIERVLNNKFSLFYSPTVSIEIYDPVKVGRLKYRFIEIPETCRGVYTGGVAADAVMLMFDPSKRGSLDALKIIWSNFLDSVVSKESCPDVWVLINISSSLSPGFLSTAFLSASSICSPERVFKVNNCSAQGICDVMYGLETYYRKS